MFTGFATAAGAQGSQTLARRVVLKDGVVLWRAAGSTNKPSFFAIFENLIGGLIPGARLPFGKSVAFLVGVSEYPYLSHDLPFVKSDIDAMRRYLIEEGGFDEVYLALGSVASRDLVESYMMNKFPSELGNRDRLLFYFAGHGADARGKTGYLLFSGAQPGDFARQVLEVRRVEEWSRVNPAGHMLFLLDSCSSGLAFSARSASAGDEQLLEAIAGAGSRAVITAGTAGEQTFEIKGGDGIGNGLFTRAFLSALRKGAAGTYTPAFLTIDRVMADVKVQVARFAAQHQKQLHPQLWRLDEEVYRGSFVFLNPATRGNRIKPEHLALLGVRASEGDNLQAEAPSQVLPAMPPSEASVPLAEATLNSEGNAISEAGDRPFEGAATSIASGPAEDATLEVTRKWSLSAAGALHTVFLDDKPVGTVGNGKTLRMTLKAGSYVLSMQYHSSGSYGGNIYVPPVTSGSKKIPITLSQGKTTRVECRNAFSLKEPVNCKVL